jgi:hypothetical protein
MTAEGGPGLAMVRCGAAFLPLLNLLYKELAPAGTAALDQSGLSWSPSPPRLGAPPLSHGPPVAQSGVHRGACATRAPS